MSGRFVRSLVIPPDKEASFRKKLDQMKQQIRQRAFEFYCRRKGPGNAMTDWLRAEDESCLCHLAGVDDDGHQIRIIAAVPDFDASHLIVNVLPDSFVVEDVPYDNRSTKHYSVFPLHETIDPAGVQAELSNGQLTIHAQTARPIGPQFAEKEHHADQHPLSN